MSAMWVGVLGTSIAAFVLKYLGHSIPQRYLENETIKRTNLYLPIALLSALVAVQTFTNKGALVMDHRAVGLAVGVVALKFRAPFPVVVVLAALTSAIVYHLHL